MVLTSLFTSTNCHAGLRKGAPHLISREVILTYPKSGTNLTICTIQILTRRPVEYYTQAMTNRLQLELDRTKTPLWRSHEAKYIRNLDPNTSKLLLVIRNYKECIVRKVLQMDDPSFTPSKLRNCVVNNEADFRQYMDNLSYYNAWPNDETKLIIYYEDLISQPRVEISKILDFFGEQDADVDGFFADYDTWMQKIMNSYKKQHGTQYSSGGNKEIYHSKNFPVSILQEIDQSIENRYPELWEKYLNRYRTVPNTPNSDSLF